MQSVSDNNAPLFAISRLRMGTDGSGITTLVTLMGCPLKCRYCLNKKCHEPIYETEDANSHLLRVMELDEESFDSVMSSLAAEGCCYFRWGGFPPWERTLPVEGNKVVFMNKQETDTVLYLMHCIAVGDDKASYLVKDWERYVDDSCYYVFTNVKGPIIVKNEDVEFLNEKTNDNCQPESILDEEDTLKLKGLFD